MQSAVTKRIRRHAQKHFAGKYTHLEIEFIWGVCYIDAYNDPAVRTEDLPPCPSRAYDQYLKEHQETVIYLCRLIYMGNRKGWGFDLFRYSSERYEPTFLPTGRMIGTPELTFHTAAQLYLNDSDSLTALLDSPSLATML